jgi:hypothetical protein
MDPPGSDNPSHRAGHSSSSSNSLSGLVSSSSCPDIAARAAALALGGAANMEEWLTRRLADSRYVTPTPDQLQGGTTDQRPTDNRFPKGAVSAGIPTGAPPRAPPRNPVRLCTKLNPVVTHSLKAPGFNLLRL